MFNGGTATSRGEAKGKISGQIESLSCGPSGKCIQMTRLKSPFYYFFHFPSKTTFLGGTIGSLGDGARWFPDFPGWREKDFVQYFSAIVFLFLFIFSFPFVNVTTKTCSSEWVGLSRPCVPRYIVVFIDGISIYSSSLYKTTPVFSTCSMNYVAVPIAFHIQLNILQGEKSSQRE